MPPDVWTSCCLGRGHLVAPSAIVQGRQRLGSAAVREIFSLTQQRWHASANHPTWAGLRLLSVDGVVWRTPDTDDNRKHYGSASNQRCHRLAKDLAAGA